MSVEDGCRIATIELTLNCPSHGSLSLLVSREFDQNSLSFMKKKTWLNLMKSLSFTMLEPELQEIVTNHQEDFNGRKDDTWSKSDEGSDDEYVIDA
ncbi:hypothetical protein GEMRC1_004767 [Eukaryota sp. GEM-RC1]